MTFHLYGKGGENAVCILVTEVVNHIIVNIQHMIFLAHKIVTVFVVGILQGQHISAISP